MRADDETVEARSQLEAVEKVLQVRAYLAASTLASDYKVFAFLVLEFENTDNQSCIQQKYLILSRAFTHEIQNNHISGEIA